MWAAEESFELLGTTFAVRFTDEATFELVSELLEPFHCSGPAAVPDRRRYALVGSNLIGENAGGPELVPYRNCQRLANAIPRAGAVTTLIAALNRHAINEFGGLAVHAGVVANETSTVVFPGDSGGGKSTMTTACLLAGLGYVSDEAFCIDPPSQRIIPYPKPISLDTKGLELLSISHLARDVWWDTNETLLTLADLDATAPTDPPPVGHIVFPEITGDDPIIEELPASQAMVALLRLSFNHYKHGEDAFHLAAKVASEARVWRLACGNPAAAARLLLARLA